MNPRPGERRPEPADSQTYVLNCSWISAITFGFRERERWFVVIVWCYLDVFGNHEAYSRVAPEVERDNG